METIDNDLFEATVVTEKTEKEITIITHGQPVHGDDLLSIHMIIQEASEAWLKENLEPGTNDLLLDVKGSKFSDKNAFAQGKKRKESTCLLVAKSLGIEKSEKWRRVIKHVNRDDLNGSPNHHNLEPILVRSQQQNRTEKNLEKAVEWYMAGIAAKIELYASDNKKGDYTFGHIHKLMKENEAKMKEAGTDPETWRKFAESVIDKHKISVHMAIKQLEKMHSQGKIMSEVIYTKGKENVIFAFESDNYRAVTATRSKFTPLHLRADVVMIKSSSGVYISGINNSDIDLRELAAALRFFEYKLKNPCLEKTFSPKTLRCDGSMKGVKEWFFHPEMNIILNSLSHGSPPTKIGLRAMLSLAAISLVNKHHFPKRINGSVLFSKKFSRQACINNKCLLGKSCPHWQIGFADCRERWQQQKA